MKKSETGAGQVSLLWVIFLVVLVLALGGVSYVAFNDLAAKDEALIAMENKLDATDASFLALQEEVDVINKLVGFRTEGSEANSHVPVITDRIQSLQDQYPNYIGKEIKTLDKVIDGLVRIHADVNVKLTEARQSFETEVELRRTAENNINTIEQGKDDRIAELEAQVNDEQTRAASERERDNERITNLQGQLDTAENNLREADNRSATMKEQYESRITMLDARLTALSRKLEVLREPELADGSVMSAMTGSALVYIDIGKKDGLRRGTKFEVFRYGKGGELLPKGWVEVRDVEFDTAKCGILSIIDKFDPIVKDDVVVNPHFSRNQEKVFVFLGDFPATYNKGFVKDRLVSLGAMVKDAVDSNTDFLVLGQKEQGDEAKELHETDSYKLANKMGVQIFRLDELLDYIKY